MSRPTTITAQTLHSTEPTLENTLKTKDPLFIDRIKSAVNTALAVKGWTQVDSGGDVSIIAIQTTQDQETLNTFYYGFGGGWGWRRFGGGGLEIWEGQPPKLRHMRSPR